MKQHCSVLVDLSDFGWAAANHLDTVEANGLDATTAFVDCFKHYLLSFLSKLPIWVSAELKV